MNPIHTIYSGEQSWSILNRIVAEYVRPGIYILVDENTSECCLPVLIKNCPPCGDAFVITIKSGETNKVIATVEMIWNQLAVGLAKRNSLLICLGGGVITDLGGFAAATFKRGMVFVHIPTTLLAMVDASIGGKTGINLNSVKNQIGTFSQPKAVFVFPELLNTLPDRQKFSGFAEMLKHALIDNEQHFEDLIKLNSPELFCTEKTILRSAAVKLRIVNDDPTENGIRKVLNLGHTIGHAIEAFSQQHDADPLSHGEAIVIGLICESFISMHVAGLNKDDVKLIANLVNLLFPHYRFKSSDMNEILALMAFDKKNIDSAQINFSLLCNIGELVWDQYPGEKLIRESLHFYLNAPMGLF